VADDRQCCCWLCTGGIGSDSRPVFLYGALDMESADMKITKDYTRKDGVRTITVQLAKGEKLMEFKDESYYRLGGQIDDVVAVHCIIQGKRVVWCSIEQKWVDV
jgi:hypothetical protein